MRNLKHLLKLAGYIACLQTVFIHQVNAQNQYAYTAISAKAKHNFVNGGEETKQSLLTVLKELNREKGVYFLYSEEIVGNKLVNPVRNIAANIEKILLEVLDNTGLSFKKVSANTFVIVSSGSKPKPEVETLAKDDNHFAEKQLSIQSFAPITGRILGPDGAPLAGVSVRVKGTTKGVTSGPNGDFSIDAEKGDILIFSFVGFQTQETRIEDNRSMSVSLSMGTNNMNEVVVTALGIRKQGRAIGYSTTEVPGSNFTQSRETNLATALSGQVAGVNVAGTSTGPSGSTRITIRGNSSLTGNNQPLYVIDGIPLDAANQGSSGQWGGADFGDALSTINPDDIESIQVLKGVASSALYGYRGGNGAILITTKSGSHNRGLGIELNNNMTFNKVIDTRDYQYVYGQGSNGLKPTTAGAAQNSETSSWGSKLDGSPAVDYLGNTVAYSPAKDNFKNFFNTGFTNQSSLALYGNNDMGHFRLGLSNLFMNTVIPNSNMQQQGVNFNSTYDVTKKLHATIVADYVFERVKNRASFSDAPGNVIAGPLYLANSFDIRSLKKYTTAAGAEILPGSDTYFNNPYFVAYNFLNATERNRLTGGITIKYDILNWLSAQGQLTRDGTIGDVTQVTPNGTGYNPGGSITQYSTNFRELNENFGFEINKKFSDISLHANIGVNSEDRINKAGGVYGSGAFVVPYFYSVTNLADKPFTYSYTHLRVNSIYASEDLGYKNFLYLTLTQRNDWYSTLNIQTDHILYPSFSGSFVFSEVLKMPSWITFGKVRASYARSSNGADPYKNLLTYGLQGYTINGQPVGFITQSEIPNNFLHPVKISEKEAGLNMQFLNSRLGLDLAVYDKITTDDILSVTIDPASGYGNNIVNIGKLENKGFEILLTGTPVKTRNFTWNASFNIATNNNKVLALSPGQDNIVIDGAYPRWGNGVSVKHIVGLSYAQIVGYGYKRDASGNKLIDANGYPVPTDDPIPLGSGIYKTTGGFNNDLHYKNLTLSFLFDFKYGAKIYSGTNLLLYSDGLQKTTLQGREGGYVAPGVTADGHTNTKAVNAQTYWQALSTGDKNIAEEFVYDASFIKLRSLSLAYTIPDKMLRKVSFIKGLTISVVSRNLATLVKHTPNIDPESNLTGTNAQGLELSGYPAVRNLGFNVNVKF